MQPSVTSTRDPWLLGAASAVADADPPLAAILRESRIETWWEIDRGHLEALQLIMDEAQAAFYANRLLCGRLSIPADAGAYETVIEDDGLTLKALQAINPDLVGFDVVEAEAGSLARQGPAPVRCVEWQRMWFRSRAEVAIAQALDRANAGVVPNPSVRLGVTQDHRDNVEPDLIVFAHGKVGIIEVDGPWHTPQTAHAEHERDRRFREHGIAVVERYSADDCTAMPDEVVAGFLRLLALNG